MTTRVLKLAPFFAPLAIATPAFAEGGHGVETRATPLFKVGPLPVTNSMVMTWIVALALVIVIRAVAGRPKLVPTRGQALVEDLIGGIKDIVDPIVGGTAIKAAFPLLMALFTYILIQNWSGLIPGVGTILMRHGDGEWMELMRPAHADMNGTIALSFCAFIAGAFLVLRFAGPRAIIVDLFGNKANKDEVPAVLYYPLSLIFIAVGFLELISIFFARPVSLSFRLYGNIFGGENLLHSMSAITRWGLPIPFYFMELLVGLVQAFVFALLIAVYIGLLTNHGDGHAQGGQAHGKPSGHH
ncbi:MAG TPA: F0F1 ATP synthase subunit A [Opitutaceae bacterium]|nr:F0F1 ATP synthase subunit A [Opitutaceae bacterium]